MEEVSSNQKLLEDHKKQIVEIQKQQEKMRSTLEEKTGLLEEVSSNQKLLEDRTKQIDKIEQQQIKMRSTLEEKTGLLEEVSSNQKLLEDRTKQIDKIEQQQKKMRSTFEEKTGLLKEVSSKQEQTAIKLKITQYQMTTTANEAIQFGQQQITSYLCKEKEQEAALVALSEKYELTNKEVGKVKQDIHLIRQQCK